MIKLIFYPFSCVILISYLLNPFSAWATLLSIDVIQIPHDYEHVHIMGSFNDGPTNNFFFDIIDPATIICDADPQHIVTITVGPDTTITIPKFTLFGMDFGPYTFTNSFTFLTPDVPISLTTEFNIGIATVKVIPYPLPSTLILLGSSLGLGAIFSLGKKYVKYRSH